MDEKAIADSAVLTVDRFSTAEFLPESPPEDPPRVSRSASLNSLHLMCKRLDKPFVLGIGTNRNAQMTITKGLIVGAVAQDNTVLADQAFPELLTIEGAGQA